jgi:hypothetical protein
LKRILFLLLLFSILFIPENALAVTIDGVITEGEYPIKGTFNEGKLEIYFKVEGDKAFFGLQGETTGWLGIGFGNTVAMRNADILIGFVKDGNAFVRDEFSREVFGPHQPDQVFGGTSDILLFSGREENGKTVIEFERLLQTGDKFDNPIPPEGEFKIIWAMGESDDLEGKHSSKGYGVLNPSAPKNTNASISFLPVHIGLILSGSLFFGWNISLVLKKKKTRTTVTRHQNLGLIGAGLLILGIGMGIFGGRLTWGFNLSTVHFFLGCISLLSASTTLALGGYAIKKRKPKIRILHVWIARTTVLSFLASLALGLFLVF